MAQTVTLIPGDGTGPEVTDSVKEVFEALGVDIEWEVAEAGETVMEEEGTPLPDSVLESIRRNKVGLKGPLTTPVGAGFRSVNVALRKELDLYANVRPSLSLPGIEGPFEDIDLIIFRENTETCTPGSSTWWARMRRSPQDHHGRAPSASVAWPASSRRRWAASTSRSPTRPTS